MQGRPVPWQRGYSLRNPMMRTVASDSLVQRSRSGNSSSWPQYRTWGNERKEGHGGVKKDSQKDTQKDHWATHCFRNTCNEVILHHVPRFSQNSKGHDDVAVDSGEGDGIAEEGHGMS
jgi:hypothetical protein